MERLIALRELVRVRHRPVPPQHARCRNAHTLFSGRLCGRACCSWGVRAVLHALALYVGAHSHGLH